MRKYFFERKYEKNWMGQDYTKGFQVYFVENGIRNDVEFVDVVNREIGQARTKAQAAVQRYQSSFGAEEAKTEDELEIAREKLATQLTGYESQIKEAGVAREALATTRGARTTGLLARTMREAMLARGEDPEKVAAMGVRATEAGGRVLQDVLQQGKIFTAGQLAEFEKFGITSGLNLKGIETRQGALSDAWMQFLMENQRRKEETQAQLSMQPGMFQQFAGGVGKAGGFLASLWLQNQFGGGGGGSGGSGPGTSFESGPYYG